MISILKNKKVLAGVILTVAIIAAYTLGRHSVRLSNDYVNNEWNKLTPETKELVKAYVIELKDKIKADVCK